MQGNNVKTQFKALLFIGVLSFSCTPQPTTAQTHEGLAESADGKLLFSQNDNLAFLEAIEFCLDQIGSDISFDQATREAILTELRLAFPSLPLEVQFRLSHARELLNLYQSRWTLISLDEKNTFAYGVLSLAFGEEAATQALGLTESTQTPAQSYDEVVDDFCINNPGVCP